MVDIVCLEAALAFRNDLMDIVDAADNDSIVFPHVDSCVAVIFLLGKGRARGGHVSMTPASTSMGGTAEVGYEPSLTEMLGRMLEWGSGDKVEEVIFVGHPTWKGYCDKLVSKQEKLTKVPVRTICAFNDPIDVFVELGTQKLRVQAWKKGARDDAAPPLRRDDWLYDERLPSA